MMGDSFRTSEKYPLGSFYYAGGYKIRGDEIVHDTGNSRSKELTVRLIFHVVKKLTRKVNGSKPLAALKLTEKVTESSRI